MQLVDAAVGRIRRSAVILLAAGVFFACDIAWPAEQAKGGRTEVDVTLVELPVLAMDRHGKPVTDVRADEIRVDYKGRQLRVGYLERTFTPNAAGLPPVRLFVDAPGGWQAPQASSAVSRGHMILFVDVENDDRLRRQEALEKIQEFVRTGIDPGVHAAVMSFNGSIQLELPFTTDREALARAVTTAWHRPPRAQLDLQARIRNLLDQLDDCVVSGNEFTKVADEQCLRDVINLYTGQLRPRAEAWLGGLKDTIAFLSGLSSRKSILVLSHGVEIDPTQTLLESIRGIFGATEQLASVQMYTGFGDTPRLMLDEVLRLAVENQVALSFVDRQPAPTSDTGARTRRKLNPGVFPAKTAWLAPQAEMTEIAAATGGILSVNPDVRSGLGEVKAAEEGRYDLGYYLDPSVPAEKIGKVDIDCTRKGVKLVHRRAYKSRAERTVPRIAGTIIIRKDPARRTTNLGGSMRSFQIQTDPKGIGYRDDGTEAVATFTLHLLVRDEEGRDRIDAYHLINHAYPLDVWKSGEARPVVIDGWVELPPGRFTLVASFRNTVTGKRGEISETVEIPAPEAPIGGAATVPPS